MPELDAWCSDRAAFVEDVATFYGLPSDVSMWPDFRKDAVKGGLMMRLMFGGVAKTWIREMNLSGSMPRVARLAAELRQLRADVFASREWRGFAAHEAARLRVEGKKRRRTKSSGRSTKSVGHKAQI